MQQTPKKSLFNELEKKAKKLEMPVTNLLFNAIMQILNSIE